MEQLREKGLLIKDFLVMLELQELRIYETQEVIFGDKLITWVGGIVHGPIVEISIDNESCSIRVNFGTVSPESDSQRQFILKFFGSQDRMGSLTEDEMELFYSIKISLVEHNEVITKTLHTHFKTVLDATKLCREFKNFIPAFTPNEPALS